MQDSNSKQIMNLMGHVLVILQNMHVCVQRDRAIGLAPGGRRRVVHLEPIEPDDYMLVGHVAEVPVGKVAGEVLQHLVPGAC